jgi:hypothetical protein
MSEHPEPVVVKVIMAVRNAKCDADATAAVAKTLTDITKLDKPTRTQYLAAMKTIVGGDNAVTDTDDDAAELAQGAAALAAVRKATPRNPEVAA